MIRARSAVLAAALAACACSGKDALNYKHCLKLRVGMTRDDMMKIMGPPDDTAPYVEGKSLPHLKGRTAYEWNNTATMPGPDHVSFSETTGQIESIRCANAEITASVYVEPPAPKVSTAAAAAVSTTSASALSTAPVEPVAPGGLADAFAAYKKKNLLEAFKIAKPLAASDNPDAQFLLGLLYSDEQVHGPEAPAEAQKWFYRASRKKHAEAAYAYALAIEKGGAQAVNVIPEFELAASLRCPAAELKRGRMLIDGYKDELAKDPEEGEKLLRQAADDGSTQALLVLSDRARDAKDLVEAYRRAKTAADRPLADKYGDPLHAYSFAWSESDRASAREKVKALEAQLTPAQRAKAKAP